MLVDRARLLVHNLSGRREGSKRKCSECIHNKVDPEHLCYCKRRFRSDKRTDKDDEASCDVHGQLEEDEPLYVLVERTAPHYCIGDCAERVVDDGHVGCLLGNSCTVAHRKTYVGCVECRSIVGTITCYSYNHVELFEKTYGPFLVVWTGTRDDFDEWESLLEFLIAHSCHVLSDKDILICVSICPEAHLTADFLCCTKCIACDNLDLNTSIKTLLDSSRHLVTYRVRDSDNAHHLEALDIKLALIEGVNAFCNIHAREAKGAHCLALIVGKLCIICGLVFCTDFGKSHDNLRSTLDIEHLLSVNLGVDDGCHVLVLCRERKSVYDLSLFTDREVVHTLLVEPKEKGAFGRVSDCLDFGRISEVKVRSCIYRDTLLDCIGCLILCECLSIEALESGLPYLHLILGKSTCLI